MNFGCWCCNQPAFFLAFYQEEALVGVFPFWNFKLRGDSFPALQYTVPSSVWVRPTKLVCREGRPNSHPPPIRAPPPKVAPALHYVLFLFGRRQNTLKHITYKYVRWNFCLPLNWKVFCYEHWCIFHECHKIFRNKLTLMILLLFPFLALFCQWRMSVSLLLPFRFVLHNFIKWIPRQEEKNLTTLISWGKCFHSASGLPPLSANFGETKIYKKT